MHTKVKVVKEARRQLEKAAAWVATLEEVDDLDADTVEEYQRAASDLHGALSSWLEASK